MLKKTKIYLLWLFLINVIVLIGWASYIQQDRDLEINFYDVGQGDSILIETPQNQQILIDGGPNNRILEYLGEDMPFYDRKIESIILSHPQHDHFFGLIEVIKRYEVEKILISEESVESDSFEELINVIREEGVPIDKVSIGQEIVIEEGLRGTILWPPEDFKSNDLNDYSIFLRLDYQNFCVLFTGDGEENIQEKILSDQEIKECEILKVPHHGGRRGLDESFVKELDPEMAVISVGKNNYGHPSEEILDRLENRRIQVLRTDKNGTIRLESDGQSFRFSTEK